MRAKQLAGLDEKSLGKAVKKAKPKLHSKVHKRPISTTRTATHKGFEIEIETTYDIKVNGQRIGGHVEVMDSGQVHYHPLPNYTWASAVNFVKQLIDSFPDDFERQEAKPKKTYRKRTAKKQTSRKRKTSKKGGR